ncbi:MAG TPA: antibiotic biosynthesis monooxygenase [Candidatus Limnocylindrales bacterium]|nr:antibiotic biosynthesis monooxygenase [Candidatus Limnocylindrales bacterium]
MYVALVHIHVKPGFAEAFIEATFDNCRHSVREAGIARFDLLRMEDEPTHFMLYEMYRTPADQLAHRETAHYVRWRDTIAGWMAEPRSADKADVLYPTEEQPDAL